MKLSIVVPAHNEEDALTDVVGRIIFHEGIGKYLYELIVVDDCSTDRTPEILDELAKKWKIIKPIHRNGGPGFGRAMKAGIEAATGDAVVPVMADLSDDLDTIPLMAASIENGYDIAFGSRFVKGGKALDYSFPKLVANRLCNNVVSLFFGFPWKDTSNAFKMYRKGLITGLDLQSTGFEFCLELALKAMMRGAKVVEIPTTWYQRKTGIAKLKLLKAASRYFWVFFTLWLKRIRGEKA